MSPCINASSINCVCNEEATFHDQTDVENYLNNERNDDFQSSTFTDEDVRKRFFEVFDHSHFKWTHNDDKCVYPRRLHPESSLYTFNSSLYEAYQNGAKTLDTILGAFYY